METLFPHGTNAEETVGIFTVGAFEECLFGKTRDSRPGGRGPFDDSGVFGFPKEFGSKEDLFQGDVFLESAREFAFTFDKEAVLSPSVVAVTQSDKIFNRRIFQASNGIVFHVHSVDGWLKTGKKRIWINGIKECSIIGNRKDKVSLMTHMNPPRNFRPEPFEYHEEVIVEIASLTNSGHGLGRIDGWVLMVPFALPGERIRARVWRNRAKYSEADLIEVLIAAPERVEPRCPIAGECGGCQYQHFAYEGQLEWKTRQVKELLERIGGITTPVNPALPSPRQYGYRSKITPHFQKPKDGQNVAIGFQQFGSRRIIDVPSCPIATDAINERLPSERELVLRGGKQFKRGGTILLRETLEGVMTDPNAAVSQRVGELIFLFQAGEFFQNNPFILPELVDHVVAETRGQDIDYLVDVFCGVGVFSLSGSRFFESATGIEVSALSVHWANANAALNHVKNCEFLVGEAENVFSEIDFDPKRTSVVIDPPRKGCHPEFLKQLVHFSPRRIVYVSCDPATQARDVKTFHEQGYQVTCVQPFDLFPQTRHIENVVTLGICRT